MHRLLTYSLISHENLCRVTLPRYPPVDPFPPIEGNRLLNFPPFLDPPVDEGLLP